MNKRTFFGIAGTAVWLTLAVWFIWYHRATLSVMTLNQWGDYCAGVVAPVAFLWLILGYFQQGEEVRSNTATLQRQQLALERQVQETAALATHSEEQAEIAAQRLDLERRRWEEERAQRKARIQPVFSCLTGTVTNPAAYEATFRNGGGLARALTIAGAIPATKAQFSISPTDVDTGMKGLLSANGLTSFPTTVTIRYIDQDGDEGLMRLECQANGTFRLALNQKTV